MREEIKNPTKVGNQEKQQLQVVGCVRTTMK